MTFWNDAKIQPKRSYRFLMSVVGANTAVKNFLIKKVTKPSFSITESEHKFLNHTFYYPGKLTWNEVNFTIVDVVDPVDNASAAVMEILEASGYRTPVSEGVTSTISKELAVGAMSSVIIRQIDSEGKNVEAWKLHNPWIKDVSFGDLDYDSEDLLNVEITLRYDNAISQFKGRGKLPSNAVSADLL